MWLLFAVAAVVAVAVVAVTMLRMTTNFKLHCEYTKTNKHSEEQSIGIHFTKDLSLSSKETYQSEAHISKVLDMDTQLTLEQAGKLAMMHTLAFHDCDPNLMKLLT